MDYPGTAVEFAKRHTNLSGIEGRWGSAHIGPGIRFACKSNAIDNPDNKGFWTEFAWGRSRKLAVIFISRKPCDLVPSPDGV